MNELQRLKQGIAGQTKPTGFSIVEVTAYCQDPEKVLQKTKQVLQSVISKTVDGWPNDEQWRNELPDWFVAACAPERSQKQAEEWLESWRMLSPDDKARAAAEDPWSLNNWLHWFKAGERTWQWWSAEVKRPNRLHVRILVQSWPFPIGSLVWLLKVGGANRVEQPAE